MFKNIKIEESTTHSIVTSQKEGNPFVIRATVGSRDGKFIGASFFTVECDGRIIDAGCRCTDYGVEHSYEGENSEMLTELCDSMSRGIEANFGIRFLEREEYEEPDAPEAPEEHEGNEEHDASEENEPKPEE